MIKLKCGSSLLLCATLLLPALSAAQDDDGPSYFSVRTFAVDPGEGARFRELQGQLTEAADEAGWPPRAVYQEVRGKVGTYYVVSGMRDFASFDDDWQPPMEEAAWDEWLTAIGRTGRSMSVVTYRRYPELSITPAEDAGPAGLVMMRFTTVFPGKSDAFRDWVANKLKPALEKGGIEGFSYSRAVLGGNPNVWVSGARIENWAALDEPGPLESLSDDERAELFDGFEDIVESTDIRMIRFLPDISSLPRE